MSSQGQQSTDGLGYFGNGVKFWETRAFGAFECRKLYWKHSKSGFERQLWASWIFEVPVTDGSCAYMMKCVPPYYRHFSWNWNVEEYFILINFPSIYLPTHCADKTTNMEQRLNVRVKMQVNNSEVMSEEQHLPVPETSSNGATLMWMIKYDEIGWLESRKIKTSRLRHEPFQWSPIAGLAILIILRIFLYIFSIDYCIYSGVVLLWRRSKPSPSPTFHFWIFECLNFPFQ